MDLNELKARAYDALVQVELWKQRVQEAQQAIANYKEPIKPTEDVDFEVKTNEDN